MRSVVQTTIYSLKLRSYIGLSDPLFLQLLQVYYYTCSWYTGTSRIPHFLIVDLQWQLRALVLSLADKVENDNTKIQHLHEFNRV